MSKPDTSIAIVNHFSEKYISSSAVTVSASVNKNWSAVYTDSSAVKQISYQILDDERTGEDIAQISEFTVRVCLFSVIFILNVYLILRLLLFILLLFIMSDILIVAILIYTNFKRFIKFFSKNSNDGIADNNEGECKKPVAELAEADTTFAEECDQTNWLIVNC